jgi:hypothetical protein
MNDWNCWGEEFTGEVICVGAEAPIEFALSNAHPNPFNPATKLTYSLAKDGQVSLIVFDEQGREVARLFQGFRQAGVYEATFDAKNLPSGIYFARLTAGEFTQTQKLLLIK